MVQNDLQPIQEITFGAASGMVGKLVEHPFDTIKVRQQSTTSETSTLRMIANTYKNEGILEGFYKGIRAPMLGACLENSILFTGYSIGTNFFKRNLISSENSLPFWSKCASGGFAGFLASFALTPVELIKCQLQVLNISTISNSSSNSYTSLIRQVLKNKGVFGLWHGWSSTCSREIFGTSIWFGSYEYLNEYLKTNTSLNNDTSLLISGAFAGLMFNLSAFPMDTIKSNIQTYEILNGKVTHDISFSYMVKKLYKTGGIKNFYNGLSITLLRAMPANALIFYTFETLSRSFG